jgi:uncharacterized protein YPO0396
MSLDKLNVLEVVVAVMEDELDALHTKVKLLERKVQAQCDNKPVTSAGFKR